MKRKSHMKIGNHNYFLSWREPWHKFEDWDWFNGRNFCRDRCMDLVSFDTPGEFKMFEEIMARDNVTSIYTSGRELATAGFLRQTPRIQRLPGRPLERLEFLSRTTTRGSRRAPSRLRTTSASPSRGCKSSTTRPAWRCSTTSTAMGSSGTTSLVTSGR